MAEFIVNGSPAEIRYPGDGADPTGTIFPFPLIEVDELRKIITGPVNVNDERSFVEVREHGASNDVLAAMYGAHLERWHVEAGRLPDEPEDELIYKIGQLYGMRLASDRYYKATGERLTAGNLGGYDVASAMVHESYEVLGETGHMSSWELERSREGGHTGTDLLSFMLAFTHDQVVQHYSELYGLEPEIPVDRIHMALHMGMLDATIFFNGHLRGQQDLPREYFKVVKQFMIRGDDETAPGDFGATSVHLRAEDGMTTYATDVESPDDIPVDHYFPLASGGGVAVIYRLVQTGPTTFERRPDYRLVNGATAESFASDYLAILDDYDGPDDYDDFYSESGSGVRKEHKWLSVSMIGGVMLGAVSGALVELLQSGEVSGPDMAINVLNGGTAGGAVNMLAWVGYIVHRHIQQSREFKISDF